MSEGPPEIMEPKLTEMVESSESPVKLSCKARGYPAPSITWTTSNGEVMTLCVFIGPLQMSVQSANQEEILWPPKAGILAPPVSI